MKKILSLLLVLVMGLSLCACGDVKTENTTSTDTASSNSSSKEEEKRYVAYEFDGRINDALTVEEVVLMPQNRNDWKMCAWKMKVRNTSEEDLKMNESSMRIWYQYLDDNGDKLFENYVTGGYSSTIKAGEAEWIEETGRPGSWTNEDVEKMATIKIYAYTTTLRGSPEHEFSEPIIINIKDHFEW